MYECPVPAWKCTGAAAQVEPASKRTSKIHRTVEQVRDCITNYLAGEGYTKIASNEWYKEGEPIFLVSKKPGVKLYRGKEGTRWMVTNLIKSF